MAQQNLYNDDHRFLKWTIKDLKQFKTPLKCILIIIVTFILLMLLRVSNVKISNVYLISAYFFLTISLLLNITVKEKKAVQTKIGLKITSRVKRLIITNIILSLLIITASYILYHDGMIDLSYLVLSLFILLINFVLMLSIIINKPVEKLVYLSYKNKAVKKLKAMPLLKVVGITGSYGKTSSKNILSDILNVKYNALPSPKNFNTPYGLIITVNNHLTKFDDVLIAEMGAYKVGEIKQLCNLVKPKYGILTKIGTAHLESFGSQENIQKGKFELIESLPSDGVGVLNGDDELQRSYKLKNNCKIIWIGIQNKDVDVFASNIKSSNEGTTFKVTFKGDKKAYEFKTKLLGYANIYNILASLALAKEFGLTVNQMQKAVLGVKSVEHRLELRNTGLITYIDDAYNSNPVGSKMALEVLKEMSGKRIVMTPGMVELGSKDYELNKAFGTYMKGCCDEVILVGKNKTKPIMDGLLETKFPKDKVYVVASTNEGFNLIKKLSDGKKSSVLIENDLPDSYNE